MLVLFFLKQVKLMSSVKCALDKLHSMLTSVDLFYFTLVL